MVMPRPGAGPTPHRRALLAAVLVATLTAGARGEIAVGRMAPALDVRQRVLGEAPIAPEALRGRLVLVVFFDTGCPRCQRAVATLNALAERHAAVGLLVIGLAREEAAAVLRFGREHGVRYTLAATGPEPLRAWDVTAYPAAFLVAPHGRIAWSGSPQDLDEATVARVLERAPALPGLPPTLAPVAEAMAAGDLLSARARAVAAAADGALAAADREAARGVVSWLAWYAQAVDRLAARDAARGRAADAWRAWSSLAAAFPGTVLGTGAADRADGLLGDPRTRREVEAARALDAARGEARAGPAEAERAYGDVAERWPDTEAGRLAARVRQDLR